MSPTHGSLSKSGKVRSLTPRDFREEVIIERGIKRPKRYWHRKKHKDPMRKNRRKFNRLQLGRWPKNNMLPSRRRR